MIQCKECDSDAKLALKIIAWEALATARWIQNQTCSSFLKSQRDIDEHVKKQQEAYDNWIRCLKKIGGEISKSEYTMLIFSLDEVSEVFENADFTLRYVGQLCESDDDPEALEETIVFSGIRWQDVSPSLLRKRFTAFSFFTEMAFFVFMPGVIVASISDPKNSHLAVENILRTLPEPSSNYLKEFYRRRWRMFNSRQIAYLIEWLKCPNASFRSYFDTSELEGAISILEYYLAMATDLEGRAK